MTSASTTTSTSSTHLAPSDSASLSLGSWEERVYEAPYLSPYLLSDPVSVSRPLCSSFDSVSAELVSFSVPSLWSDPLYRTHAPQHQSAAQIVWNEDGIHVLYRLKGPFQDACDRPDDKMTILNDSRVELFVFPRSNSVYYNGYEFNRAGRVLDFRCRLIKQFDYDWKGQARGTYIPCNDDDKQQTQL